MYDAVLVTGNRDFGDFNLIYDRLYDNLDRGGSLIVGDAWGADNLSAWAASSLGIEVVCFHAEWNKYGSYAGPIRNGAMVSELVRRRDEGASVYVFAFALEKSVEFARLGGTADCLRRVREAGLPYQFNVSDRMTGSATFHRSKFWHGREVR